MSQYPPYPPQQPQQPQPPQSPQYPPAGGFPPPGYGAPPPGGPYPGPMPFGPPPGAGTTNGPAIASLICGLLLCVPFLTGLLAVILGFFGLGKAKRTYGRGRGLAITGIVLGFLGLLGWGIFGPYAYHLYMGVKADAKDFVQAMADGKIDTAASLCHTGMARSSLQRDSDQLRALGKLNDVTVTGVEGNKSSGGAGTLAVNGTADFANRKVTFTIQFQEENGALKIVQYNFR